MVALDVVRSRVSSWLLARAYRKAEIGRQLSDLADDADSWAELLENPLLARERSEAVEISLRFRSRALVLAAIADRWLRWARRLSPHDLSRPAPAGRRPRRRQAIH